VQKTAITRAVGGKAPMRHIKTLIIGGSTDVSIALAHGINIMTIRDATIAELIHAGADPNIVYGTPALIRLAHSNRVTAAEMLLDAGADIHIYKNGRTPLREAVSQNRVAMVRMLIARGARVSDVVPLGNNMHYTDSRIKQMLLDTPGVKRAYAAEKLKRSNKKAKESAKKRHAASAS
jgi:ankyrin repeat protein